MPHHKKRLKLNVTIGLFVCLVVAFSLMVTDLIVSKQVAANTHQDLVDRSRMVANIMANSITVIECLSGLDDERDIQIFANRTLKKANVQFITVMDMNRVRKSHPDPENIGKVYELSDANPAFAGQESTSTESGSLGPSLRTFVPVFAADGRQIGVVLVGILLNEVEQAVDVSRAGVFVGIYLGMFVGLSGALLLANHIKKAMFGLEPSEIAQLLEERNAMLQATREGMIAIDAEGRVTLVNSAAIKLLAAVGIHHDILGESVEECIPNTRLHEVLVNGNPEYDHEQNLHGVTWLTNRVPVRVSDRIVGAISTFRDMTEITQLAEKLVGIQNYAEALRSQTHEFMNKLHVILGMVRLGKFDHIQPYVSQIAKHYQVEVGSVIRRIKDPVLAGFILGKISRGRELNVLLELQEDSNLPEAASEETVHDLITILGNLIDNAMESLQDAAEKNIRLELTHQDGCLTARIFDSGPGIPLAMQPRIFDHGFSSKGPNRGIGLHLALNSALRLGGNIQIERSAADGTTFVVQLPYPEKGGPEID